MADSGTRGRRLARGVALACLAAGLLWGAAPAAAQAPERAEPADRGTAAAAEPGARPAFRAPLGPEAPQAAPGAPARPARDAAPAPLRRLREIARSERGRRWTAPLRRLTRDLAAEETRPQALRLLGVAVGGVVGIPLALFVVLPLVRGRGDLVVTLAYPEELDGTFRVRISRGRPKEKRGRRRRRRAAPGAVADPGVDRAATRTDHPMVARETRFQRVQARPWWVYVEGVLQDPESDEVLESRFHQERVRLRRGKSVRLSVDLRPERCPVDVKVLWDKRPVREALVALHGVPGSTRRARGGTVRLKLARGPHTVVVGSGDRVAERAIDVTSFRTTWAVVDLGDGGELLFAGCPPAVEPYLQGDYAAAARVLEREGQGRVAHVLLGRLDEEHGRTAAAAEHYEAADRLAQAAELWASLGEFERSATLFDRAGLLLRAGEMYRAAGEPAAAGGAYQRAEEWALAAACYREAGESLHLAGALEQLGSYFEAAELYLAQSDWTRALRNLQHVPAGDARHARAALLQADCHERLGDPELALRVLEEVVARAGPEGAPLDVQHRLAQALEQAGEAERALRLYERIRERDAAWPDVTTRIETLRKQLSRQQNATVAHAPGVGEAFRRPGSRRYEVLEEIGRGGMGVVFRARDQRLGRIVALKQLPENLRNHPKAVELFLREARAAAALNHPNIVTLFDADEEDGTFFLTMELLEGRNLYSILKQAGRVKPRDVARLGLQACAGLAYAHDRGIVHRDIKTANFFFTRDKVLKIMDFGLAKMVEEVRRAATIVAGTPYYMAPEQSAGEAVDGRTDLYALGVTFFELLTGGLPFEDGDVAFHHRHTPAPDPRERRPELPEALARLVLDLMGKTPAARPGSAGDVASRLQAYLAEG